MTAPNSTSSTGPSREETILEWFQRNGRTITISAVVLVVAAGAYWYYNRSVELKNQAAERALNTALQSVTAGNQALAVSDLRKVADQYNDTQSGIEAGLLVAQLDYNAGKVDSGLVVLKKLLESKAANMDATSIYSLLGDGQMQAGKAADAAASYQKAAGVANSDDEKAYQQSKAARAFLTAGDTASAAKLWQSLANDPKAQGVSAEARVRLGEIEAKPAVAKAN
ncbi:MAG TPA: tetratricopeptide repeat protein [Gemmatimonadaceae bacterium]|nr:tetratricopeptide repeat protein [Gemmatimonadaceae bacterium]